MRKSRRVFLTTTFSAAAAAALAGRAAAQMEQQQQHDSPPLPGAPRIDPDSQPVARRDPKLELKANQDHIKKNIAKLSQLVADLQKGLDDNDTTEVLSLDVIHKTEEIEKLAKQIRELVRGY